MTDEAADRERAIALWREAYRRQMAGDLDGAIETYRRSIDVYPTAEAHTFLGWVYSSLQLYDEAIAACKDAIATDPTFGNPYNDIGSYLIEQEQYLAAIEWLKQALDAPRYGARHYAHFNLGRAYEHLGDWETALEHYTRSLGVNPSYNEARRAFNSLRTKLN